MSQKQSDLSKNSHGIALVPALIITAGVGLLGLTGYMIYRAVNNRAAPDESASINASSLITPDESALSQLSFEQAERVQNAINRIGGDDRFTTAVDVSRLRFPRGADTVYIANGYQYPDALLAANHASDGPLLYAPQPGEVGEAFSALMGEVTRLKPKNAVLFGGTAVLSEDIENRLRALVKNVRRIAGDSRVETAVLATHSGNKALNDTVYITNGYDKDAAALLLPRTVQPGDILFSNGRLIPEPTLTHILKLSPRRLILVGGTAAVPESVERTLRERFPDVTIERWSGGNRYATAVELSKKIHLSIPRGGTDRVFIVNAEAETDSLVASTFKSADGGPVLLVNQNNIPEETMAEFRRLKPREVIVVGGNARVSESVAQYLSGVTQGYFVPASAD